MIPGLTIKDILKLVKKSKMVRSYLPDLEDWVHVDRKWLCDMLYTLDTERFQAHIDTARAARRKALEGRTSSLVGIRAEIANAVQRSVVFRLGKCTQTGPQSNMAG